MSIAIAHTWYMTVRYLRNLSRQSWYVAFTLVQPVIWSLLFGSLFQRVVELPGFTAGSYISFLTPGVVVMSALFGAGWNGMGIIEDLDRGVLDRFLAAPSSRVALIAGRLVQLAVVTTVQSLIIVGLGVLVGASFPGGALGVTALIVCAILLAMPFGALSNAMALLARQQESVIAAVNFVQMPLTFTSSVFMAEGLMPAWMQGIARFNPVNWAIVAGRSALGASGDWPAVLIRAEYLLAFTVVALWLATRAFRAYQRSV